ncbi:DUF2955 domain-containing protein [Shewanella canadensis]|uniref:DUF2955 domain-containing protein n=1 Tax=Shewanella canadensis TaxID=271096 RepID=A0A3S0RYX2_9GAMM|nr:DUF2955 domain-containing protein [Shewanella canadensis]RTR39630.1 DUF2955 domain-containing protein [Shewanella canadensis]
MSINAMNTSRGDGFLKDMIRYVLAVMVPVIITMIWQWELAYICPTLVTVLVAPKAQVLSKHQVYSLLLAMLGSSIVSILLIGLIKPYPVVSIIATGWVLYWTFRFQAKGGSLLVALLWLLSTLSYPAFAVLDMQFTINNITGLLTSYSIAIAASIFCFALIPNKNTVNQTRKSEEYNEHEVSRFALQNTLVLLPLFTAFIMFELQYGILFLIYASLLVTQGSLNQGLKSLVGLMMANGLGGLVAIIAFELSIMAPIAPFYMSVVLLFSMIFTYKTFTKGALYSSAFSCFLILLTDVTTTIGYSVDTFFYERLLFIALANLYVLCAFIVLKAGNALKSSPKPIYS